MTKICPFLGEVQGSCWLFWPYAEGLCLSHTIKGSLGGNRCPTDLEKGICSKVVTVAAYLSFFFPDSDFQTSLILAYFCFVKSCFKWSQSVFCSQSKNDYFV